MTTLGYAVLVEQRPGIPMTLHDLVAWVPDLHTWGATWGPVATVAQAAISLIGFLFVFWQLQAATQDRLYAHYSEVCKLFLDRPHLRPYFYDKKERPVSSPDEHRSLNDEIDAMSEMILGLIEHSVVQRRYLPRDSWSHCWRPYATERVRKSPTIQNFYAENKHWYAAKLGKQIKLILDDASPK